MLAVFQKAMRDSRKTALWLGIGSILYIIMVVSFYPTMVDQAEELNDLLKSYPEGMLAAVYGQSADEIDITNIGGYVHSQFAVWLLLILGALIIYQAFNAFTNAERDGTMDILLSLPITRREVLAGRILATIVFVLVILAACSVGLLLGRVVFPEFDVSLGDVLLMMFGAVPILLVMIAFSYMLATLVPSRMRFAGAIAYLFVIGSYILYSFAVGVDSLKDLQPYLIYNYYNAGTLFREGIDWSGWAVLAAMMLVFGAIAFWSVDRKELGV